MEKRILERKLARAEAKVKILEDSFEERTRELYQAEREARVQNQYLGDILNSIGYSLIVVDKSGKIKRTNLSALSLLGYEEKELLGNHFRIIFKKIETRGALDPLLKGGFLVQTETTVQRKDNREVPVMVTGSLLRDDKGENQGAIFVAHDITEQLKQQRSLQERTDKLQRFQNLTVGRELTMVRLKEEVNTLLKKLGQPKKYEAPDRIRSRES